MSNNQINQSRASASPNSKNNSLNLGQSDLKPHTTSIKYDNSVQDLKRDQAYHLSLLVLVALSIASPIFAAGFGAASIGFKEVAAVFAQLILPDSIPMDVSVLSERIILELRMPRIVLAFVAGAGLAIAGSVLQTVTRNPLAEPYLFGISSGASFGAVVVISVFSSVGVFAQNDMGASSWWQWSQLSLPIGAFVGACMSVLIVLSLSSFGRANQVERMLLAGVASSFMFGALTSLVLYFSSPQATASVLFWSLGSFAKATWAGLVLPSVIVFGSIVIILGFKRQIMALQAGDETAHTLGVNVVKMRLAMLLLCSLITAVLVANCGGIGFVGLMVPHTVRLLFPGRQPIVFTALLGGLFMVWVDVVARCILGNQELPVGIITAIIGSVFFLFILRRRR